MQEGSETFILPQIIQFGYHNVCGKDMVIADNSRGAKRRGIYFCHGVVYSALPLNNTAEFEVVLKSNGVARYKTGQGIQVDKISFDSIHHCVWNCEYTVYNNLGPYPTQRWYGTHKLYLNEGERVGLRLNHDGKLLFFLNGVSHGVAAKNVYKEGYDVYAVVEHVQFDNCVTAITRAGRRGEKRWECCVVCS